LTERTAPKRSSRLERILVLALFLLLFLVARLPLFSLGWDGEDANGHDADIFIHQPAKPDYLLAARVHGREIHLPPLGHPGATYEMFAAMGRAAQTVVDVRALSDAQIIAMLKVIGSAFQLAIWLPLLWLIGRSCGDGKTRLVGYGCILALALCPISIKSSNEFQIDSLFGFVMAGAYALALVAAGSNMVGGLAGAALVMLGAAFVGLGKNEWTLVLLLASIGSMVAIKLLDLAGYPLREPRALLRLSLATLVGLGLGNLANYLFEPGLYMSGWWLLSQMVTSKSIVGDAGRASFLTVTAQRLPFIRPLLFLIAFIGWRSIVDRRQLSPAVVLGSLFGFGLFGAFFISTWAAFPRYFAPAFAALSVVATWQYTRQTASAATLIVCTLVSCWFGIAGFLYARSDKLAAASASGIHDLPSGSGTDCAVLVPVEDAYRKKLDFVHRGYGYGAAGIAERYGGRLCPAS
jgi:hypothetical protein